MPCCAPRVQGACETCTSAPPLLPTAESTALGYLKMSESGGDSEEELQGQGLGATARAFMLQQTLPSIGVAAGDTTDTGSSEDDDEGVDVGAIVFSGVQWEQQVPASSAAPAGAGSGVAPPASPGAQAAASPPRSPPGAPPAADAAAEVQAPEPDSDDGEAEEPEEGEAIEASLGEGWFRGAAGRLAGMGSRSLEEQGDASTSGLAPEQVAQQEAALLARFNAIVHGQAGAGLDEEGQAEAAAEAEASAAAAAEPRAPLLDDTLGGVQVGDLDDLIARLQGGWVLDLASTRPAHLPDPSTLFTPSESEDDEAPAPAPAAPAARPRPAPAAAPKPQQSKPAAEPPARTAAAAAPPAAPPAAAQAPRVQPSTAAPVPAAAAPAAASAASAPAAAAPGPAAPPVGGPPRLDAAAMSMLPPRLRALAARGMLPGGLPGGPPAAAAAAAAAPAVAASQPEQAAEEGPPKRGVIVQDLRQSIQETMAAVAAPQKPKVPATSTSHTGTGIGVGGDDNPGEQTGATRRMFVSTSDLPPWEPPSRQAGGAAGAAPGAPAVQGNGQAAVKSPAPAAAPAAKAESRSTGTAAAPPVAAASTKQESQAKAPAAGAGSRAAAPPAAAAAAAAAESAAPARASASTDTGPEFVGAQKAGTSYGLPSKAPGAPAKEEEGVRVVTAGTRIVMPRGPIPEPPTSHSISTGTDAEDVGTSTATDEEPAAAAAAASAPQASPAAQVPPASQAGAAAPGAKAPPAPVTTQQPPPPQPPPSPGAKQPTKAAAPPPPSPTAGSGAAAQQLLQQAHPLPRLPSWASDSNLFTIALAHPEGMTTHRVAAAACWLLALQTASLQHPLGFSVVSLALARPSQGSPLLARLRASCPEVAEATKGDAPGPWCLLAACCPGTPASASAAAGTAAPATAGAAQSADAEVAAALAMQAAQRFLDKASWAEVLAKSPAAALTAGAAGSAASGAPGAAAAHPLLQQGLRLSAWGCCIEGAEDLAGLATTLQPHQAHAPKAATAAAQAAPATPGAAAPTLQLALPQAPGPAAAGAEAFVCSIARGALESPKVLGAVLARACEVGCTLAGLATVYLEEGAAHALAARTPHRLAASQPAVLLALHGRSSAAARWQSQLGPPDPAVALKAEPHSLHALLAGPGATGVHRLLASSFDAKEGARDLATFFGTVSSGGSGAVSAGAPAAGAAAPAGAAAAPSTAAAAASGGASAAAAAPAWLALHAGTRHELLCSLWALHRLAWAGYGLQAMLRTSLAKPAAGASGGSSHSSGQGPVPMPSELTAVAEQGSPIVVVQAEKEEGRAQLGAVLGALPSLHQNLSSTPADQEQAGSTPPPSPSGTGSGGRIGSAAASTLLPSAPEAVKAAVSKVPTLLPMHEAYEFLQQAEKQRGSSAGAQGAGSAAGVHGSKGVDAVAVVAVQGAMQDALLMAMELVGPAGSPCECVALSQFKHLPSGMARNFSTCVDAASAKEKVPTEGSNSKGALPLPTSGQALLLLALHGPDPQEYVRHAVANYRAAVLGKAGVSVGGSGSSEQQEEQGQEATAGAAGGPAQGVLAGVSGSLPRPCGPGPLLVAWCGEEDGNRSLLAHCFHPAYQVHLDPTFHTGARPSLPSHLAPQQAAGTPAAAMHLLMGPHPYTTVLAVSAKAAPGAHGTGVTAGRSHDPLPQLLKLLAKEGFSLQSLRMSQLTEQESKLLLGSPSVAHQAAPQGQQQQQQPAQAQAQQLGPGAPAVLLRLARSNATHHLLSVLHKSGLAGPGIAAAPTAQAAAQLVECGTGQAGLLSPLPAGKASLVPCSSDSFVQATCLVVLPPKAKAGPTGAAATAGAGPGLEWPRLAEALEFLRTDGFQVMGMQADRLSVAQVTELCKQLGSVSAAQGLAAGTTQGGTPSSPQEANVVVLALARQNGVSQLLMRAAAAQGAGAAAGGMRGGPSLAGVASSMVVAQSASAAEKCIARYFPSLLDSFSISKSS